MHYVIGDVHGSYKTLLTLTEKLPHDARLIFVGDLIDRGKESAEVVRFVRENNHLCVMGNHEEMMFTYGFALVEAYENATPIPQHNIWYSNGGIETLRSYGLIRLVDGRPAKVEDFELPLQRFKADMKWMEKLPLYIELDIKHSSGKPVVISHAPLDTVWNLRHIDSMYTTFHRIATTNRRNPDEDAKIFNIFGHTPVQDGVEIKAHYVNVDTGCYMGNESEIHGYKRLSAYCVQTGEAVSVAYVG